MASNHNVSDGALYLHRCIACSNCTIDWKVVGAALDLKPGTASKRYSRLRDRIDKSRAVLSAKWSGKLDSDGIFLFQCIRSCACQVSAQGSRNSFGGTGDGLQIDFNAVGKALGFKPGTASKRYSRLLAKYKKTEGDCDESPAATTPEARPTSKKRNTFAEDESDNEKPSPPKKRKVNAQLEPPTGAGQNKIKQEDQDEPVGGNEADIMGPQLAGRPVGDAAIPATDGPGDSSSRTKVNVTGSADLIWPTWRPRTRGKKIGFSRMLSPDSGIDETSEADSDGYAQSLVDSDDEASSDSDNESKALPVKPPHLTAARSPNSSRGRLASHFVKYTPVGLSGVQMWQTGEIPQTPASKIATTLASTMATSAALVQDSDDEQDFVSARRSVGRSTPDVHTDHAVQLQQELEADGQLAPDEEEDSPSEEVMQSIEVFRLQGPGLLNRLTSWWK